MNFDTSFRSVLAESTSVPGVVVPNVEVPELDTVIVTGELVVDAPWLSVTFNRALYVPFDVYVYDGLAAVESPNVPSPFRSQEYERVSPAFGSDDALPSKFTVNGALPAVGDAVATAVGGVLPPPAYLISRIVPLFRSA